MKIIKFIILATSFYLPNLLMASDPSNPSLNLTGGSPSPNPVCVGTSVSASVAGSYSDPTSTNSEFAITNRVWSWTSSVGSCDPANGDGNTTWSNTFTSSGIYTNIVTASVDFQGYLGTNYFDVSTNASVTNIIYVFSPSHFDVFVCQPWPNYPNDGFNNDPDDPLYNPAPVGYPYWSLGDNGGHAWWKLISDTPANVVDVFANANASQWLNTEVGYGETNGLDWLYAILNVTSSSGPGILPFPNTHTATVHRTYAIEFQSSGLIDGLNHTEHVHEYPGTYDLRYHNCVIEVMITGGASGVTLPSDWLPELFGFDLPPDNP